MKTILAAVISLDGKITKHNEDDLHSWVSTEDQEHFSRLVDNSDAIIIGRKTYELMRGNIEHREGLLRLIITSKPDDFSSETVPGQIEFIKADPASIVDYLTQLKKKNVLIAGGTRIITDFLAAGCVDELYITIEPKIFGNGAELVSGRELDVDLELVKSTYLNDAATILMHYKIL